MELSKSYVFENLINENRLKHQEMTAAITLNPCN